MGGRPPRAHEGGGAPPPNFAARRAPPGNNPPPKRLGGPRKKKKGGWFQKPKIFSALFPREIFRRVVPREDFPPGNRGAPPRGDSLWVFPPAPRVWPPRPGWHRPAPQVYRSDDPGPARSGSCWVCMTVPQGLCLGGAAVRGKRLNSDVQRSGCSSAYRHTAVDRIGL